MFSVLACLASETFLLGFCFCQWWRCLFYVSLWYYPQLCLSNMPGRFTSHTLTTFLLYFVQVSLLASLCALFCEVGVLSVLLTSQQVPVAEQCFTQQYDFKTWFIYVSKVKHSKGPMTGSTLPHRSPQTHKHIPQRFTAFHFTSFCQCYDSIKNRQHFFKWTFCGSSTFESFIVLVKYWNISLKMCSHPDRAENTEYGF